MVNNNDDLENKITWLMGQVSTLGIGLQAVIQHHPNKKEVAATIYENYEQAISKIYPTKMPDDFLRGMKSALDLYLLKSD